MVPSFMVPPMAVQGSATDSPGNRLTSALEVAEFHENRPERYFLYIDVNRGLATTWVGDPLGRVDFGRTWRDNFGGKRQTVTIRTCHGAVYHGTHFVSSGDYARVKLAKGSAALLGAS